MTYSLTALKGAYPDVVVVKRSVPRFDFRKFRLGWHDVTFEYDGKLSR
jgi:hypothetical protein